MTACATSTSFCRFLSTGFPPPPPPPPKKKDLRMSSLESMAALFSAYDCPYYQKLILDHIADLQSYPSILIDYFRAGGTGWSGSCSCTRQICVNRDMKMAVSWPTQPYLKKTTHFFSYRIKAQKQLTSQLLPSTNEASTIQDKKILDCTTVTKHWEENVEKMCSLISEHQFFTPIIEHNRGLVNVLTGTKATTEQIHDLVNARVIGQ